MNDVDLITQGLKWLSDNIEMRNGELKETQQDASIYAERQLRVIRRILDYVEDQEDARVILMRKLLELNLHEDIRDISMIAIMGKKPLESFSTYERLLITKNILGEGSRWA